jgi:Cu(I)/Ag(I) efflux system membrane fusion protein
MSTRNQLALSAFIVVAALAAVALRIGSGEAAPGPADQGGHDHAAMMAGSDAMQPVMLDEEGSRRIGVTFATVEHRELTSVVRTVGTVAFDETRLTTVNLKVEGWVEHLHVDFTGAPVTAGEPLMEVYSPALVTAQEELVLAARLVREATEGRALRNAEDLLASARRRLEYWDVPAEEIRRIQESGVPVKTLTLTAPASGIVVEKNVVEGDRIMPGMTVYRVADLSRVWVEAEVFEKDLGLVAEGQEARVTFESYPGREFTGRVTYVHPTVSVQSRTARVRLELANPSLALKPGMYAEIELASLPTTPTMVVPRSAVIQTGQRTLVFVRADNGALMPREVEPGRTSGRYMQILSGVSPGERVVASAAFLVDAESNLGTMTGDMGEMEMSGEAMDTVPDVDHSQHQMDHSQHQMGAMQPDTSGSAR